MTAIQFAVANQIALTLGHAWARRYYDPQRDTPARYSDGTTFDPSVELPSLPLTEADVRAAIARIEAEEDARCTEPWMRGLPVPEPDFRGSVCHTTQTGRTSYEVCSNGDAMIDINREDVGAVMSAIVFASPQEGGETDKITAVSPLNVHLRHMAALVEIMAAARAGQERYEYAVNSIDCGAE